MKRSHYCSALIILSISSYCYAKDLYIIDKLYIPLRNEPNRNGSINRTLQSGDKVTPTGKVNGDYLEVSTENSIGWLPNRYVSDSMTSKLQLEALQKQLEKMKLNAEALKKSHKTKVTEFTSANTELLQTKKKLISVSTELEKIKSISADAIQTSEEKIALSQEAAISAARIRELEEKLTSAESDRRNEGIKLGLIAVSIGLLFGLVFPFLRPRKKFSSAVRLR